MNAEERRLSELLHRVTPEPPRGLAVEDVAFRLAGQGTPRGNLREGRTWRGWIWSRTWAPVLAAASVFVVAGASAGIAVLATSHHSPSSLSAGTPSSASASSVSSSPGHTPTSPGIPASAVPGGPWGAALVNRQMFTPDSLVSAGNSLYAIKAGALDRIDPATGNVAATAPLSSLPTDPPLVLGSTVWLVSYYGGGSVVLHGYNDQTLAQTAAVTVPAIGQVSSTAQGVMAAGPDGNLYLAAGDTVAILDPASDQVIRRIYLTAGPASSVAVSPDGSKLYVFTGSLSLLTYDLSTGIVASSSRLTDGGAGNLIATAGGVWGTAGTGMSEWVWFAPDGDLSRSFRVGQGGGAGLYAFPAYSGGAVWIGGSSTLVCASPVTGQALASAAVPADHDITENFGSIAMADGHAFASYQNQAAQQYGLAKMTPPLACAGARS